MLRSVLSAACVCLSLPAAAQDWTNYTSRQYGLRIAYPDHLVDEARSDPSQGQYTLKGDAQLILSLDELGGADLRSFLDQNLLKDVKVTYTRRKGGWMAYSGYVASYIVYGRTQLSCRGRFAHTFMIRYPIAERAIYDRAVERLSHSLKVDPAFLERAC